MVGNGNAYTLKEAYDQGLVNIESVVALIYEKDDIHYNFKITRTETPIIETPQTLQNRYPSNEFSLTKLGDLGSLSLYYNITEYYHYQKYNETLGDYVFDCFAQQLPYELGLYVVDKYNAYTLQEAYSQGLVNIESVVSLINSNNRIKYNFNITKAPTTPTVKKTTVNLQKASAKLYIKGSTKIKANVKNGVGKTTYKSSDKSIAKVDSNGKVTALKKGTAKITVTNNKVSKTFTVTVKKPFLNKTSLKIKKGAKFTLKVTGKVGKAKFITSNKKIAAVNQKGKITAKKKGNATVTVKTNGIKLKCKVKVK